MTRKVTMEPAATGWSNAETGEEHLTPERRLTIVKPSMDPVCRHQDSGHGPCGPPGNGEACWDHREVGGSIAAGRVPARDRPTSQREPAAGERGVVRDVAAVGLNHVGAFRWNTRHHTQTYVGS